VEYHVVVPGGISRAIRDSGLSREGRNRVLSQLHAELRYRADEYRGDRTADDPTLFQCPVALIDGDQGHLFEFTVDDTTAAGYLFVVSVRHHSFPSP
jgi:hypothetical protein